MINQFGGIFNIAFDCRILHSSFTATDLSDSKVPAMPLGYPEDVSFFSLIRYVKETNITIKLKTYIRITCL